MYYMICVIQEKAVPFIPRGNSGTSHSALGSQWLIAFVVADFAKGFRHAEIKRSIAPPLPIRAKSRRRLWGPRLNRRATKASALPKNLRFSGTPKRKPLSTEATCAQCLPKPVRTDCLTGNRAFANQGYERSQATKPFLLCQLKSKQSSEMYRLKRA